MLTIFHNARCQKSREGLELLKNSGKDYQVREYLKNPLTSEELTNLLKKLKITPQELIRTKEEVWKKNFRDKKLSDEELITIIVENPKLIERPILESDTAAVIGRPPEKFNSILV